MTLRDHTHRQKLHIEPCGPPSLTLGSMEDSFLDEVRRLKEDDLEFMDEGGAGKVGKLNSLNEVGADGVCGCDGCRVVELRKFCTWDATTERHAPPVSATTCTILPSCHRRT